MYWLMLLYIALRFGEVRLAQRGIELRVQRVARRSPNCGVRTQDAEEALRVGVVARLAEEVQRAAGSADHRSEIVRTPGGALAVTLKPDFSRLAANAWKFRGGSGMYGRETLVGYQNSTGTGSVRPAD